MMNTRWPLVLGVSFLMLSMSASWAQETPPTEELPSDQPAVEEGLDAEVEVIAPGEAEESEEDDAGESEAPGEDVAAPTSEAPAATGNVPEIYEIQSGDTLWDICQKFLDNPWYWPKLWSLNQYIENPHLIFPGNKVAFWAGSETSTPRMDIVGDNVPVLESAEPVKSEQRTSVAVVEPEKKTQGIKLKTTKFIAERNLKILGEISHSGSQKQNLIFGDQVYLDLKRGTQVSVGDKFHVVEKIKKVKDPNSFFGSSLGTLVHKKAVLKVVALHKKTVEAVVVDNEDPVMRGDEIIAYVPSIHDVVPHAANKDMKGEIVESDNQEYLISQNVFVYLNLGRKNGIEEGQQLMVVRRGDGVFPGDDRHLPDVVVGRLLVVETGDRTSTAYVTDVKDSLEVGDRVRSQM